MRYRTLLLILLFGNVAWAGLTADQLKKIRIGIASNDSKSVIDTLGGVEDPFRCPKKGLGKLFDNTPSHYCKADSDGQELLKSAFKTRPCRDEIIVELLKSGARYDFGGRNSLEQTFTDAFEGVCSKTVDYLIQNSPEADVAAAAAKFFLHAERKAQSYIEGLRNGYEIDKDGIEALKPISTSFKAFVIEKCPDSIKASPVCNARETFDQTKARTEKSMNHALAEAEIEDAKEAHANSPEGLREAICEIDKQIGEAQAEIDRQKKIGKVSGTVNMLVLNQAGAQIIDLRDARKVLSKKLKSKTGKKTGPYICK